MRHPLTLEAFAEWLEKQPPEKTYDYTSCRSCAAFQYMSWVGLPIACIVPGHWYAIGGGYHTLPPNFEFIVSGHRSANPTYYSQKRDENGARHTFGAAAQRARALLESRP